VQTEDSVHLVRHEDWATIDLDVTHGHVFVRQDWRYTWAPPPAGLTPWTEDEKRDYHHKVDRLIWGHWSMRAGIVVRRREIRSPNVAAKDVLQRFSHRHLTLSFDVRSVTAGHHWEVTVAKVAPDAEELPQALCYFAQKRMELYDFSVESHRASRYKGDPKANPGFYAVPHEYGHALGYENVHKRPDEYLVKSPHFKDVRSIMNIGHRVRARHLFLIMKTLGRMVPACAFAARIET
jgi:hypothetical protein